MAVTSTRHWRRHYTFRRPHDYRAPRYWVGTSPQVVVVGNARVFAYILGA